MFLEQWLEGATTRGNSREGDKGSTYVIFSLGVSRTLALVTTVAVQPVCFQHLNIMLLRPSLSLLYS